MSAYWKRRRNPSKNSLNHKEDTHKNITYTKRSDYYYPDLVLPPQPTGDIGRFGRMRKKYLKEHQPDTFALMLMDIFPEGRLSPDGRSNPIVEGASFYRKLKVDLVLVRITGAYFSKPKWRKRKYQSNINLKVVRVITREELGTMTNTEVEQAIKTALYTDANETLIDTYPQADKAEGLEGLLYRCPDCGELYSTKGRGNTFFCKKCGARHTLNDRYLFEDDGKTSSIADFYDAIKALEAPELDTFELRTKVRTKIYGENGGPIRWENGECSLNSREFSYHSDKENFKVPTEDLPAMAYSCNEEFELYHNNELHYFYPEKDRQQAARWALLVDMLAERRQKQKGETE